MADSSSEVSDGEGNSGAVVSPVSTSPVNDPSVRTTSSVDSPEVGTGTAVDSVRELDFLVFSEDGARTLGEDPLVPKTTD